MDRLICRICGWQGPAKERVCRERMFGWGDEFVYLGCGGCGCLQIREVPPDLARFYPAHYYSHRPQALPRTGVRARLGTLRDRLLATGRVLTGRLLHAMSPGRLELLALAELAPGLDDAILDVGSGAGQLLSTLARAGYRRLVGVDPLLSESSPPGAVPQLLRAELEQVPGRFDLIMLHHVIEHVAEPQALLEAVRGRLSPRGRVLLRTPNLASEAWLRYGVSWVQLDAPRHLAVHTPRSLEILGQRAGLTLARLWYDSTEFQFVGSELYLRGLPLFDAQGRPTRAHDHLSAAQIRAFRRRAAELNAACRGDQVVAVFEPG